MALPESINQCNTNFWEVEGIGHDWLPNVLGKFFCNKTLQLVNQVMIIELLIII